MSETDKRIYDVGFGKPPKRTRFQPGISGNPRGRPKSSPNLGTVLARSLREKVVINENGASRTVTKLEAATKRLVDKAAAGDLAAIRLLSALLATADHDATKARENELSETDIQLMNNVLKRFQASQGESDDTPDD